MFGLHAVSCPQNSAAGYCHLQVGELPSRVSYVWGVPSLDAYPCRHLHKPKGPYFSANQMFYVRLHTLRLNTPLTRWKTLHNMAADGRFPATALQPDQLSFRAQKQTANTSCRVARCTRAGERVKSVKQLHGFPPTSISFGWTFVKVGHLFDFGCSWRPLPTFESRPLKLVFRFVQACRHFRGFALFGGAPMWIGV